MNSTYEFGIYLTHFCNVDLFRQGLYFFRIGLYNKVDDITGESSDGQIKHYALPYRTMLGKQHERDFLVRSQDRSASSGHIDDVTSSYCSSVFRVQYQEQKVRLNEGCLFRLDLPYEPKQRVYIDIELVFCELHASDYKSKGFPTFEEFTIVDKTTLCMEDCYHGIHSIYPVSFSTSHFCLVNCMVHGELINFKFIPPPPQHKLIAKYAKLKEMNGKNISDMNHHYNNQHVINHQQSARIKEKNNNDNNNNNNKDKKDNKDDMVNNNTNNTNNNTNNNNTERIYEPIQGISSFAEVLFYDRVDCILTDSDWDIVSEHHLFYVACLLHTYDKLQNYVHSYIDKYLDDANISSLQTEFDELYPVPNIELDSYFNVDDNNNNNNDDDDDADNNNIDGIEIINGFNAANKWKYHSLIDRISDRFSSSEKLEITGRKICHIIGEDIHVIAGQVFRVWHFFLSIIPFCKRLLTKQLLYEWEKSFVERWGACIFRETLTIRARLRVVSTSLSEHEMISRKVRSQSTLNQLEAPPLQDIIYMIHPKQHAVIFEQTYNLPDNRSSESIRLLDQINNNQKKASNILKKLSIPTIPASHKKKLKQKFKKKRKDKDNNKGFIVIHRKKEKEKEKNKDEFEEEKKSENGKEEIKCDENNKMSSIIQQQQSQSGFELEIETETEKSSKTESRKIIINKQRSLDDTDVIPPMVDSLHINKLQHGANSNLSDKHDNKNDDDDDDDDFIKKKKKKKNKKNKYLDNNLLDDTDCNITHHECIGKHLFILVHGYQGNSWDMRMFRNHLLVKCPNDLFLMSESNENEGETEGDIKSMGERLATEIDQFINLNIISCKNKLCRISFICHSLGGIIAREAITNKIFEAYLNKCYTFISLAVCHCGYLFGRSKALQAGFWVMRSWKKSLCLSQLSLTDNDNPRKTFLYKLSLKNGLSHFKNVLLVSSPEDRYTPYHSTRIEMHRKTVQDTKWGRIYNEMVRNLLRPLDKVNLTRFDVSFVNRKINLDSMIGRSAHICFLEQPLYIDMLIHVYKKYFLST